MKALLKVKRKWVLIPQPQAVKEKTPCIVPAQKVILEISIAA